VATFAWPTGRENLPKGFEVRSFRTDAEPTRLIPFPDGRRVLLVCGDGIFVLSSDQAVRLHPSTEELKSQFESSKVNFPEDELSVELSMEHATISHDGKLIALGSQFSTHLIHDENLKLVGDIGNRSEYPHYALFSKDDSMIAFNSCHFYNGVTLGVPRDLLPVLDSKPYEEDERFSVLEDGSRVYAGTCRNDEFIIGDASGHVRAFNSKGQQLWLLHIGSSVGDMDLSDDGELLVVSTYAGFISIIQMDAGEQPAYQIGSSRHAERRRWIFWKNEPRPLIW
jgi:hypothetical protein